MKINSKKMVSECQVCQINQGDIVKSLGLFQPLLILNQIWEEISMDLITGLPKSKDKIPFLWLWIDSNNINIFVEFKVHILQVK